MEAIEYGFLKIEKNEWKMKFIKNETNEMKTQ